MVCTPLIQYSKDKVGGSLNLGYILRPWEKGKEEGRKGGREIIKKGRQTNSHLGVVVYNSSIQEDSKFEDSLSYIVISRPGCITQRDYVSKKKRKPKKRKINSCTRYNSIIVQNYIISLSEM